MNTFKHKAIDSIKGDTLFKDIDFYKWLAIHYIDNLTNNHLTSIYQYLHSLGFVLGVNKLTPLQVQNLKNCFKIFFYDNQKLYKTPRIHELKNMLEFANKDVEGSIFLSVNEHVTRLSSIKSGWYVPTGALKLTLDSYPNVYGTVSKENHSLFLDSANTSYGTSYHPYKLMVRLDKIHVNKNICKINK